MHQGTGKLMWARTEVITEKKPGEYCLSCHNKGGSAEKVLVEGFSHPMDIILPEKMPSLTLPLFDDTRGENINGKIRCATCHNFHDPFPYYNDPEKEGSQHGKFLRLSEEGSAGICNHCHPQHAFVEGTDHDLSITGPEFINSLGHTPSQGGICSPCHVVHAATEPKYLWAAPIGPPLLQGWEQVYIVTNDYMTGLCTGCHSPGNIAATQMPDFGLHPKGFLVPEEQTNPDMPKIAFEMVKEEFPIFSPRGEIADSGNIVCSTCHNPHQWDPFNPSKGSGKEVEGNATNSFLRPYLHSKFCTVCHGRDGLIKFKYYHSQIGRKKRETPFSFTGSEDRYQE
jgi:hypothetical protein